MPLSQKVREKLPLIIAVICGILSILLLNIYLRRREAEIWHKVEEIQRQSQPPIEPPEKSGIVLLAKEDIPSQSPITPDDLLMQEIPVKYIQPGAVSVLGEAIGQIVSVPITAGEQILKTKLMPPGKVGKTLSEITPEGKRALTVSVDNVSSVAGLLKPGDFVDVFALITPPAGVAWGDAPVTEKKGTPCLVPLFQGIEVLAIGAEFIPSLEDSDVSSGKRRSAGGKSSPDSGIITLALEPQEAILLSFVQEQGKIKLALRSSEDEEVKPVRAGDWDALFRYLYPSKRVEEPAKFKGEPLTVEIYRGLRREFMPLSEGE